MNYEINTIIAISVFGASYLLLLFYKSAKLKVDLLDMALLSSVAIIPTIFVYFPSFSGFFTKLIGVSLPFVICFGMLFSILFFMIIRLNLKIYALEENHKRLIQEIAINNIKKTLDD